ncbi:MAG: restriction endonuclease [Clostridium sp.]|nr:restriction endonuclease [Clostridium sp.]MDY6227776.1 restriction endonuclease [Clostridium sp.]
MKANVINKIIEYIYINFSEDKVELYEYLYNNLENIAKYVALDSDLLEEEVVDRNSKYYEKIAKNIQKNNKSNIKIVEIEPYFYLETIIKTNIIKKVNYLNKIDNILNKYKYNRKGFIYQDFVILFLKECGINIIEQNKTCDGGLDIVGTKTISIIDNINININIYGQVKFYNKVVTLNEIKQLVKDKIYRVLYEKNSIMECNQTIFISHKGFSNKAREFAENNNIIVLDTDEIITQILNKSEMKLSLKFIDTYSL